jgi:type I restriction enzyme S subunit
MTGEWRDCLLGDVIELKRGYDLPERERRSGAVPIISSSGASGFHDQVKVKGPGVVTGRYGTIGQVFYVPGDFWPLNTTLYVRDFKGNDPRFVSYFLRGLDYLAYSDKAAVPGINRNHLHQAEVQFPEDVDEQRAIAQILGTLDDKIELNRRMSETLEGMARTLFKSWFVDFDPVRAKAEGRDPGLPKPLVDLFPASLVDGEVGQIPEGWSISSIGDMCRRIAMGPFGSDITTDTFVESGVPVIRGVNLTDGFVEDGFVFVTPVKADQLRNANAFRGDIVITHRGTLGQVGLIPERSRFERYVVSQSQMLMSADLDVATPRYLYNFLRSEAGQHALLANTSQTGVPAIARPTSSLRSMRCLAPPLRVLNAFDWIVAPLDNRGDHATEESRTLATLRSTLLPKLVSGELRVKDAERFIGKVA